MNNRHWNKSGPDWKEAFLAVLLFGIAFIVWNYLSHYYWQLMGWTVK